ncbi:hypothetical protein [Paenibacillus bouchesdurhonensis]|uniref:hypothetical protein n=1 Tax=Paenibacillus bouchesdurhonensis TaxID=1870990 RepID=UPI000DA60016|nr:hypothetical protein [Paenibacillus bouchesdurhonensis]
MKELEMIIDQSAEEYLKSIINEMIKLFQISEEEAYGRINRFWSGKNLVGDHIMLYHLNENYWANTIYYRKNSYWWLREGEKIEPLPYP